MEFLTVAGIELEMTRFVERAPEVRGEAVRAFDNTLMDGTDAPRRVFDGDTYWMTVDDADALRAAVAAGAVLCTGPALRGAALLCKVVIGDAPYGPDVQAGREDWTDFNQALSLNVREV